MNAIYTVLRKELIEQFGERHSLRGPLLQAAVLLITTGILVPALDPLIWISGPAPIVLFELFPAVVASMIAADAFAGERERHTLETLLATPLSEAAMFIGKILSAVTFGLLLSAASLAMAVIVSSVRFGMVFLSPAMLGGVIAGSLSASLFTSAVAVMVSSRTDVARSAQQISSILALGFLFAAGVMLQRLGSLTAGAMLIADGVVTAAALVLTFFAARAFRRDRLFD